MKRTTGYVTTDGTFFEIHREKEAQEHEIKIKLAKLCADIVPDNVFREINSQELARVLFSNRDRLQRVLSGVDEPMSAADRGEQS